MSSGSSLALQLIGRSDLITVVNADTTFWQFSFQTHTPFQIEPKRFDFTNSVDYGKLNTTQLYRTGDYWKQVYLCLKLDRLDSGNGGARCVDDVGRALIEQCQLEIGSVYFDTQQGEIMHAMEELDTHRENHYGRLTGKSSSVAELTDWGKRQQFLMIKIDIWWNKVPFPIVAAYLNEPKLKLKFRQKSDLIVPTAGPYVITADDLKILDAYIHIEVVLLEEGERNYVADSQNVYVIDQVQLQTATLQAGQTTAKVSFTLNHPVRELIMFARSATNTTNKNWFNFTGPEVGIYQSELFESMSLRINGNDRWEPQNPFYFRVVHPKHHHTRKPDKNIYVFSFALNPEIPNPNGSVNFSRIDTADLNFRFSAPLPENYEFFLFGRNHNSIAVEKGSTRLAFAS